MTPSPGPKTDCPPSTPFRRWLPTIPLALALTACGGDGGSGPGDPGVATVQVSPNPVTLEEGQTAQLSATCHDPSGSPLGCGATSWSSSADALATVNPTGLVTAVSDGTVTITARAGGRAGHASVEVLPAVPQETISATAAGGTFTVLDGAVTLEIPAGAVTTATEITVRAKEGVTGDPYVPGTRFEFAPDGLNFAESVLLTIAFDTAGIPVAADADLVRLHRVSAGGAELLLGSRLDLEQGTVSGLIDGFSEFEALPVTIQGLLAGLLAMALAMEEGDQRELAILQEAYRQDVKAVYIPMNEMCLASSSLSVKGPLFRHLHTIKTAVHSHLVGLEDLLELTDSPCGGLDDPDATDIEVTPSPLRLGVGGKVQLETVIRGPNGEELTGELEWGSRYHDKATVSDQGLVEGMGHGETLIVVFSKDIPTIDGSTTAEVLPDLLLQPSPTDLKVAIGHNGGITVMVSDTSNSLDVSTVPVEWTIGDASILSELLTGPGPPPLLAVRAESLGETNLKACAAGFGPGSCIIIPAEVVFNVEGVWEFNETLSVDLDSPETEVCTVNGVMTIVQSGDTYTGTANENGTCTYDAGDGSEPVEFSVSAGGDITEGSIEDDTFSHLGTFDTSEGAEWCRTEGTLIATGEPGFARATTGTVQCIDDEDWYSWGPSQGTWLRLANPSGAAGAIPALQVPFWPLRKPPTTIPASAHPQLMKRENNALWGRTRLPIPQGQVQEGLGGPSRT